MGIHNFEREYKKEKLILAGTLELWYGKLPLYKINNEKLIEPYILLNNLVRVLTDVGEFIIDIDDIFKDLKTDIDLEFNLNNSNKNIILDMSKINYKPARISEKHDEEITINNIPIMMFTFNGEDRLYLTNKELSSIVKVKNYNNTFLELYSPRNYSKDNERIWFFVPLFHDIKTYEGDKCLNLIDKRLNGWNEPLKINLNKNPFKKANSKISRKESYNLIIELDLRPSEIKELLKISSEINNVMDKTLYLEQKEKNDNDIKKKLKIIKYFYENQATKKSICEIFSIGSTQLNKIIKFKYRFNIDITYIDDIKFNRKYDKNEKEIIELYLKISSEDKKELLNYYNYISSKNKIYNNNWILDNHPSSILEKYIPNIRKLKWSEIKIIYFFASLLLVNNNTEKYSRLLYNSMKYKELLSDKDEKWRDEI